jgi:hypothetical protein
LTRCATRGRGRRGVGVSNLTEGCRAAQGQLRIGCLVQLLVEDAQNASCINPNAAFGKLKTELDQLLLDVGTLLKNCLGVARWCPERFPDAFLIYPSLFGPSAPQINNNVAHLSCIFLVIVYPTSLTLVDSAHKADLMASRHCCQYSIR